MTLETEGNPSAPEMKTLEETTRKRLLKFGIDEDNISLNVTGNRIKVEITELSHYEPGTGERLRKMLQSSANLEFWETYTVGEIYPQLEAALVIPAYDTVPKDDSRQRRLFGLLMHEDVNPEIFRLCAFGSADPRDTALVRTMLDSAAQKASIQNLVFAFTKPNPGMHDRCELLFLKASHGKAAMSHPNFTEVKTAEGYNGMPEIQFTMDKADGEVWRRVTKANVGRCIAIVLDGIVYTYPNVQSEITGGVASITGNFTKKEANDLAAVLSAGYLPYRLRIVEYNETK